MAPRFPEILNVGPSNPCFLRKRTWEEGTRKIMSLVRHMKTEVTLTYPSRVI